MNERIEKETIRLWREEYAKVFNNDAYCLACLQNVAQHFYNLALADVKKEIERRYDDNLKAADRFAPRSYSRGLFSSAAKEDFDIVSFIDNQKQ